MLFLSKSEREQRLAVGRALEAGTIGEAEAGERLLQLDPDSGAAYLALGRARFAAGDLGEAESLFWQGLDRSPLVYPCYMALSDVRRKRDADDPLAPRLRILGIWKLSFADEIADTIAESFRGKSKGLNFKDPLTYEMLATAYEVQEKDAADPPEVPDRLLPYRLLNDLQRQAPTVVAGHLLHEILANSERCLPLWRAALRDWGKNPLAVSTKALALIVALLGEIAGVDVLDDLLDLATLHDDVIFLHTHWAIWRIGQRFPSETLAKFRAATPSAPLALRCGLAEQINLLPELEGMAPALIDLLEDFSGFADNQDAPYLLMVVVDAMSELGLDEGAQQVLDRYRGALPKKGRKTLQALIDIEGGFVPRLIEQEIDEVDIEDVSIRRVLMADEVDEEDEDAEDSDEEESFDEEWFKPEAPRAKPERNDPCWCGSGKKYKKCHLAADEEAGRSDRKPEAERPKSPQVVGEPLYKALLQKLLDASPEIRSRAEALEANRRYFDREPDEVDPESPGAEGFIDWFAYDFRPGGTGRTLVEEYLRRHSARLTARERALLDSWRAARLGLFEVQRIETGIGVELKDLFAGGQFFVHDVSSSRSSAQWDCILTRVQEFEGRTIFSGNGLMVARTLLPRLLAIVEEESRDAGQPAAEFVRANSHRWHRVLGQLHQEQLDGLRMVNAEGDKIEFSSATYLVRDEAGLMASLAAAQVFEETTGADETSGVRRFGWLETGADGPRRAYGHIEIREGRLRLECNSRRRLKTGRQLLEKNAGAYLTHECDRFESVSEAKERLSREGPPKKTATGIPPEVERELLLRLKTEHYAKWPDESLPALGGKTPRQAVKSEVGRRAVEDLIRQFENSEGRRQDGEPSFDFSPIRKALGLDR
jgi:tetratricopeptide (TPR) repeat protein